MNRIIKFRAWDSETKSIIAWNKLTPEMPAGDPMANLDGYFNRNYSFRFMQFTGLLDKNGKEIFEGDIVQVFYHEKPQIDENKAYTVVIEDIRKGFFGVGEGHGEVIGNIYENPELLKV